MSQSASQARAFYREVAATGRIWTIKDDGGFPAPKNSCDERAQPFWSSLSRVQRVIASVPAYAGFRPCELSWKDFEQRWIPGLTRDGIKIGLNWSGPRAKGYDADPVAVLNAIEYEIQRRKKL